MNELYENLEIWGKKIERSDGGQLAVVGFCSPGSAQKCTERAEQLKALSFQTEDIVQIDFILASRLRELFPEDVPAVGASVHIPALSSRVLPTGGVLGSPCAKGESSQSELEDMGGGLWLYTQPGGPGWVAAGPRAAAESILQAMKKLNLPRREVIPRLMGELEARCPAGFLVISDGTGIGSRGFAAAGNRSRTMAYVLP